MLEVHVEKGMQHNQKIVFSGDADEAVSRMNPLNKILFFLSAYVCFVLFGSVDQAALVW